MKKKLLSILFSLVLVLTLGLVTAVPAAAAVEDPPNTVESSTMIFQGSLDNSVAGVYTGIIPMVNELAESLGDNIAGFDVYAKWGGCAFVEGYYGIGHWNCVGPDTAVIGSDYDAYGESGGLWGPWYDPDVADWDMYELELTADHWFLRYAPTQESPMSGMMDWKAMYAAETDQGTTDDPLGDETDPVNNPYPAGSAQEWGWNCGWGEERIPLEFPGFDVGVSDGGGGVYTVTLTPAATPPTSLYANVPDIMAISVLPTSIDFGDLFPGQSALGDDITVKNIGTLTVDVDARLTEPSSVLFKEHLELRNGPNFSDWGVGPSWSAIVDGLAMDTSDDVKTKLTVAGHTPSGTETAKLIFTVRTPS